MINKEADSVLKQLLSSLNPFAVASDSYRVDRLPRLAEDDLTNKALINAIVAGSGFFGMSAITKAIYHKLNARKWENKNKKIVTDKVNSLYPFIAPNYDKDSTMTEEVRNIGLDSLTKEASFWKDFAKTAETALKGSLPITTALTAAIVAPSLVQERLEDKDEAELDQKITDRRNELDALRAKLIDLQLPKNAGSKDEGDDAGKNNEDVSKFLSYTLGSILAFAAPGVFLATNSYLRTNDNAYNVTKAGEASAARNLTNIPQKISLKLTSSGRPAISKAEQGYVKELKALASEAAEANIQKEVRQLDTPPEVDFNDKLTHMKKDALFS
jgi:hypothetical protein